METNENEGTEGSRFETNDPPTINNSEAENRNGYAEFTSTDNNCFIDNASIDTASIDNNCFQDSISVDNSSINVSMDLHENSESTLDLQEITQSILDLERTQTSPNLDYDSSTELQRLSQLVPSSPPPSYEHVLAETKLEQSRALADHATEQASASVPLTSKSSKELSSPTEPQKGIIIRHKSHKEFYRAVAKECGITCKMSDHCRCLDCQSGYFKCEYDENEQEKTDGGLGAGTPMFISSEIMHGSACTLL